MEALDLPLIWAGLLALAVLMYVLMDGFDLGVGILFPFADSSAQRDQMMQSVAPVWDGNETWLVLGGGGLFAAFPAAYAAMMPALYMPLGFMLTALIFRGVAFEFRARAGRTGRRVWDQAFHLGSLTAAFSQGLILGALVQGIHLEQGRFAGGMFDWLTPFSFFVGWGLVWGYVLLGATWLIIKTAGDLQMLARRAALLAAFVVLLMMAAVSLWVPLISPFAAAQWGLALPDPNWSRLLPLLPIPLLAALSFARLLAALRRGATHAPYLWSIALFVLGNIGLRGGIGPHLVPYGLTIWQAAAAPASQAFLLTGTLVLLPLILVYTGYAYWTFRGKVREDGGYH